jgi:hypothetical protein
MLIGDLKNKRDGVLALVECFLLIPIHPPANITLLPLERVCCLRVARRSFLWNNGNQQGHTHVRASWNMYAHLCA